MGDEEPRTETVETMELDAGALCLNFANTANWHASDHPIEYLTEFADLVIFGRRTESLSEAQARRLQAKALQLPAQAASVLEQAISLRETIYRIFSDVAREQAPAEEDVAFLNLYLGGALSQARVVATPEGFSWSWDETSDALDRMLWPVARSAADLLTSDERYRVGKCAEEQRGCGWLFLDMSRNHSRRWCDMNDCGNREKARRHYHRQRAARP